MNLVPLLYGSTVVWRQYFIRLILLTMSSNFLDSFQIINYCSSECTVHLKKYYFTLPGSVLRKCEVPEPLTVTQYVDSKLMAAEAKEKTEYL